MDTNRALSHGGFNDVGTNQKSHLSLFLVQNGNMQRLKFCIMSMTGSIIKYIKFTDSPSNNGKPIYLYWVEPSLPIKLPYKIEIVRKRSAWYKRIARKQWINRQLFEWGEMYCAGHYTLFGDTNELFLTENGKELFMKKRDNFSRLQNFSVRNINTARISYFTNEKFDCLNPKDTVYLN